jgi:hypothetical protein
MNIPTLQKFKASNPDGTMHQDLQNFLVQLVSQLQTNLSNEGFTMPPLNSTQITQISGSPTIQRIVYNSTTQKMMLNNNGTFQTINVT